MKGFHVKGVGHTPLISRSKHRRFSLRHLGEVVASDLLLMSDSVNEV